MLLKARIDRSVNFNAKRVTWILLDLQTKHNSDKTCYEDSKNYKKLQKAKNKSQKKKKKFGA